MKQQLFRLSVVGLSAALALTISVGLIGGCGTKADPAVEASASPAPSASPDAEASPSPAAPVIFTSETFDSRADGVFVGPSPGPTTIASDAAAGGTVQTWRLFPNDGTDAWGITSHQVHVSAFSSMAGELAVSTTSPTTCTVKVKLATLPAANKLAGLIFRTNTIGAEAINFIYDNGAAATAGLVGSGPAGYKLLVPTTTPPSVVEISTGVVTFPHTTPTAGDVLQITVTPTQVMASVIPASGTPESHTYDNTTYNTYMGVGLTSSDTSVMFDDFVVQDCN